MKGNESHNDIATLTLCDIYFLIPCEHIAWNLEINSSVVVNWNTSFSQQEKLQHTYKTIFEGNETNLLT